MNLNAPQRNKRRPSGINLFFKKLNQHKLLAIVLFITCLIPAVAYFLLKDQQYIISAKIIARKDSSQTNNNTSSSKVLSAREIKADFTSSNALRKAIRDADIASNYTFQHLDTSKNTGIELSPIKINLKYAGKNLIQKNLKVQVINNLYYKVDDGEEKPEIHRFGDLVDKVYAEFEIDKRYSFADERPVVFISFEDIDQLSDRYKKDLILQEDASKKEVISVNMITNQPDKDQQFIAALLNNFNEKKQVNTENQRLLLQNIDDSISMVNNNIKNLSKAKTKIEKKTVDVKPVQTISNDEREKLLKQVKVLDAVAPYVRSSVNEFVIVPANFIDFDEGLKYKIEIYNTNQTTKQNLLSKNDDNSKVIIDANFKLAELRNDILAEINVKKNYINAQLKNPSVKPETITTTTVIKPDQALIDAEKKVLQGLLAKRNALPENKSNKSLEIVEKINYEKAKEPLDQSVLLGSFLLAFLIPSVVIAGKSLKEEKVDEAREEIKVVKEKLQPKQKVVKHNTEPVKEPKPVIEPHIEEKLNEPVNAFNIEEYTKIPILGTVGHVDEPVSAKYNLKTEEDIKVGFKNIYTEIERLNTLKKFKVILVSSGSRKEGKTFFSVNIAAAIAAAGKKVVLVDFNLVKPNLLKRFNLNYYKGVSSYILNDNLSLRGIILDSKINPNLSIVGAGPLKENPEVMLRNQRTKDLFREMRKKFDYIILDVPSIAGSAYLHRILPFADFSIFVARVNNTLRNQLQSVNDLISTTNLKNSAIVLNDTPESNF